MIKLDDTSLLMIEPTGPASAAPVMDELTYKMRRALANERLSDYVYKGWHTCVCGVCSDNNDHFVATVDGGEYLTNSLAVHYLMFHRDEVPESELEKVRSLP